ncbi:hypothetical protein DL240_00075 [Lujinxingia litoralis]|uniref:HD/PDEase domain-containing protein n=1 Tax=Lujinxingia litoralis TaxID=2211119 RepID=A0A328CDD3_9DELT|nr:HD domain-containing protein [Lujinxingia litoralis]RAL24643.1 hypothetical protein DL240_00075 [Lujinxingia litoralis]
MSSSNPFGSLPELRRDAMGTTVRVPELRNIALTPRVEAILDHPAFQRLRRVRMLGPTHLVYPGAVHTRFEHSLGVYGCTRWFLQSLGRIPELASSLSEVDLLSVLAAGLLHDIGHYPFAHSLEALHLKGEDTPRHEEVGGRIIMGEFEALRGERSIAEILSSQWGVEPERVIALCTGNLGARPSQIDQLLHSIISGTIDADKMDYLERDSHHIGVPYGRTYDRERLLANLTLNADETRLAIAAKGKVPAEMFVFSRYTMFSEVYWHHTVRAASAMVENAIAAFHSRAQIDPDDFLGYLLRFDDEELLSWLFEHSPDPSAPRFLLGGLQTTRRRLYKRVATFSRIYAERDKQRAYETIYQMERAQLFDLTARLSARLGSAVGVPLHPAALIIDIPPRDKDRIDSIDVVYPRARGKRFYPLHQLSQVVNGIQDDFIAVVKKIRIFAEPSLAAQLRDLKGVEDLLLTEILKS